MVQAEEKRISRSERQMTTPLFLLRAQQNEDRNMSRRKRKLRRKAAELIALKVLKKRRRRRRRAGIGGKAARLLAVLAAASYLKTGIFRGRGEEDSQVAANTKRRGLFVRKSAAAAVKAPKRKQGIPRRILGGAMRFAGRKLTQKKTPKKGLLFFKR
jgi:hypothetical protein